MAPEQFRDPRSVDVKADMYGFGVVLFEMITGRSRSMAARSMPSAISIPAQTGLDRPSVHNRHAKLASRVDEIVQLPQERPRPKVRQRRRTAESH